MQSPVRVTHHGRPRAVLMSVDDFERLGDRPASPDDAPQQGLADALQALMGGMGEGFIAVDDQLRIRAVNAVAEAYLGRSAPFLVGRPIGELEQADRSAIFLERLRWVLRAGEATSFVAKTLQTGAARTLSVRAFPYAGGVGVLYANITRQEALQERLEEIEAESLALAAHEGVGVASLDAFGFFARANAGLAAMFGLTIEQVSHVRLIDLVRPSGRGAVADGMNRLLKLETDAFNADVELMCRDGSQTTARLSMTRRMREQTCQGFAAVIVPNPAMPASV